MPNPDPPAKKDFFISYNKADREWAEWVAWHLEETGHYSVAIQAWDFGPGSNFVLEMDRAIQECERVIAVLSPDYVTSLFTKPEWAAYFAQDPTSERRRIISVRVRECELKGLLSPIVYADVIGKPENEAKAVLLDAVKIGRRKPESAPGFPGRKVSSKPRFPGALPDIWHVPHLRNPNFTEPGERLTEMRDALRSGKPAALTQALAGLGGVGKTQLAIEYAYRCAADYGIIWWVRSEQAATLAADYAALARPLDLQEKDAAEQPVIIAAVRDGLQHRRDWLLIFDNANAPEEIRDYLPAMGGHVLITSRHAAWGAVAQTVQVKKWAPNVAAEFLLKRTGQTDVEAAKELAQELDYLPLALEQAAAYIEATQKTLPGYLAMFRQHQLALLKRARPGSDYPATVERTWELSFQRLETESPGGVALLQLCAFLAPDDIPRDVIVSGAQHLPEPLRETVRDGLAFDNAVRAIRRYSLIDTTGESTLSMHRLVQAVVRDRLDWPGRQGWAEAAVKVVNRAFPAQSDDVRTRKECDRLLPHAIAAVDFAEGLDVAPEGTTRLLNQMCMYALGRAEYIKAKAAVERALKIDERAFAPDHVKVASHLNNLGIVLAELGDIAGARVAYERALEIDEKAFGPDHPEVATDVNNIGVVLKLLNDLPGARAAFERALGIDERALGPDDPQVAPDVNNLGGVLEDMGDLSGAKAAYERALKINEKAFGPDHPSVATCVNNIGNVLSTLGDLSGAKAAFERALGIDEKALGPDHPNVATDVNNLGGVLTARGDFPGAKAAYERALKIYENVFGLHHSRVAACVNNLGTLLRAMGDLSGAKAAFERALEIDEKAVGPDHPAVATDVNNLASVLKKLGDLEGARSAYERALKILRESLGDDHPKTEIVRKNIASLPS
jgi:tetratricopeptide (TPR) repeat protein